MKRKFIVVLTSLCLLFSLCLVACGKGKDKPNEVETETFTVISRDITVAVGETADIAVESNKKEDITYSSYNTAVASVSDAGKVTGVAEGQTFIAVKLGDKQSVCKVTVTDNTSAVLLGSEKINLAVGSVKEWNAIVLQNGERQDVDVIWQVTDADKCTFTHSGNTATFTATQTGEFTVTASFGQTSASCAVRVVSANAKRLAAPTNVTLDCGGALGWTATENASEYVIVVNGTQELKTQEISANLEEYALALKNGEKLSVAIEAVAGDNYDYIDSLFAFTETAHVYTREEQNDISCKTYGNVKYTCSECEHTYTDENVLNEHTWDGNSCSVCGAAGSALTVTNELLGWRMQPGVSEYAVWINGVQVGKTTATNFDLSECFALDREGKYTVDVRPLGVQSMFITAKVNVVLLNKDNFVQTLSAPAEGFTYYVLTEDITLSHTYSENTLHDADGLLPADQLCSSPIAGIKNAVFEGNGHKISVTFDGTTKTNNSWEIMSGLFGYTDNALIRNVRTDLNISQPGHLHRIFSSGALVAVMKGNTRIEDCYIKSRIKLNSNADYNTNGGYGAVAGLVREGNALSTIQRCVIDSAMYNGSAAMGAPKATVGVMATDVLVTNNAYVVNESIPNRDAQMQATYQEAFLSWALPSQNWLFASLSDFMFGENGDYCDYNATGAWEFKWAYDRNPAAYYGTGKLFETKSWNGTTFAYDAVDGFTLCGNAIVTPDEQTPQIEHGVLTWNGSAAQYKIYNNDALLDTVEDKTFDLASALKFAEGNYTIRIEPVGYNELITYSAVEFKIVGLTNDNFVNKLSGTDIAGTYFVLKEDVTHTFVYQDNSKVLYTPIAKFENATLDGRGHKISVNYTGAGYATEMLGGLFGETKYALIKNVNFELTALLGGNRVLPNAYSAAFIHAAMDGTRVENCYIRSRITATSDVPDKDNENDATKLTSHFGPIVANIPQGNVVVIRNCVIDSAIYRNGVLLPNTMTLGGSSIVTPLFMQNNAYIVNGAVKAEDFAAGTDDAPAGIYKSLFYTDSITAENWLFENLSDFLLGNNGNYCKSENWNCTWTTNISPADKHGNKKLYESDAWSGTTFAFDTTNGFTLCDRAIFAATQETPELREGVLSWTGEAKNYKLLVGETEITTVQDTNCQVADAILAAIEEGKINTAISNTYSVTVSPVGYNSEKTYNAVIVKVVGLTQDNFVTVLSASSADGYYVLTEDITLAYRKDTSGDYGNEGDVMHGHSVGTWNNGGVDGMENVLAPIKTMQGVLDGKGYTVTVSYTGDVTKASGLFAEVKNAHIKNLAFKANFGLWGNSTGGAFAVVLGANATIENCYIMSRITASDGDVTSKFGALAWRVYYSDGSQPIVRHCVIDSEIKHFSSQAHIRQTSPMIVDLPKAVALQENAYIVNAQIVDADVEKTDSSTGDYYGKFTCSNGANNMLYESIADFANGVAAYKCTVTNWNIAWAKGESAKVYESWDGTTFAYDDTNGLTLCGKSVATIDA